MEILTAGQKAAATRRKNEEEFFKREEEQMARRLACYEALTEEQREEMKQAFSCIGSKIEAANAALVREMESRYSHLDRMVHSLVDTFYKRHGWHVLMALIEQYEVRDYEIPDRVYRAIVMLDAGDDIEADGKTHDERHPGSRTA